MVTYTFYKDEYHGTAIEEPQWQGLEARAQAQMAKWKRSIRFDGEARDLNMAICAMAESMAETDAAGELRSASIGSVSVVYRVRSREKVLLEKASAFLDIYRGVG